MVLSSQIRKGKGPNRIKQAKHKQLDTFNFRRIQDVDWLASLSTKS
jgi:regulatory protein